MTVAAPLLLLDGASMWFRSFFGVPSSITAPDGRPVNALRGFLDCRRHGDHPRAARPPGGVPRRRLAAAVAGGPHPVVQGAPRRRGGTGGPTRYRRGARRSHPAGRHDHGDPRRVRHPDRGRAGMRGRRRAGHAGRPGAQGPRRRRERRPRSASAGSRRAGAGPGALPRSRPGEGDEVRARGGRRAPTAFRSTGPDRHTPSWRCCGAIRPTGCPACPASARRRRPHCWPSTARWRASWPPPTTRNRRCPRRIGRSCSRPPTTSRPPGPWSRWPPTPTSAISTKSDDLPLAAEHPRKVAKLAEQYGVTSSIGRLQKALDGAAGPRLDYLGRPTS